MATGLANDYFATRPKPYTVTASDLDSVNNYLNQTTVEVRIASRGGTGIASYTVGDLLYASAGDTLSKRAAVADGNYLRSYGVGAAPQWSVPTQNEITNLKTTDVVTFSGVNVATVSASGQITSTVTTGTAPLVIASTTVVANLNADRLDGQHAPSGTIVGTTDAQTLTNKSLRDDLTYIVDGVTPTKRALFQAGSISAATDRTFTFPDASGTFNLIDVAQTITGAKTYNADDLLVVAGTYWSSATHTHSAASSGGTIAHSATTGITANDHHNQVHGIDSGDHTGTLSVENGGTGNTSFTQYSVVLGNGTSTMPDTGAGTDGQVLIAANSVNPSWGALRARATGMFGNGTYDTMGTDGDLDIAIPVPADNVKLLFGTSSDAAIYYNTSNLIINPREVGTGRVVIQNGGLRLQADNLELSFGAGNDATMYYDATDLVINPDAVGSGDLRIDGGFETSVTTDSAITIATSDNPIGNGQSLTLKTYKAGNPGSWPNTDNNSDQSWDNPLIDWSSLSLTDKLVLQTMKFQLSITNPTYSTADGGLPGGNYDVTWDYTLNGGTSWTQGGEDLNIGDRSSGTIGFTATSVTFRGDQISGDVLIRFTMVADENDAFDSLDLGTSVASIKAGIHVT